MTEHELVLEDAAWIADTGRFADALKGGSFLEVEPFPDGEAIIGRGAIVDACVRRDWMEEVMSEQSELERVLAALDANASLSMCFGPTERVELADAARLLRAQAEAIRRAGGTMTDAAVSADPFATIAPLILNKTATGSRVICSPPPMDSDEDWIVLVLRLYDFNAAAVADGWKCGKKKTKDEGGEYPMEFDSYRKESLNLIVTADEEFFRRFNAATYVAKRLNLLSKSDRISLFQAVLYGNIYDR